MSTNDGAHYQAIHRSVRGGRPDGYGDVITLDNLSSHKSACASEMLHNVVTWFLFLPPYSPDLNPTEMAFSKLKALIRKVAARTYEELWQAVGHVCSLFSPKECYNFFKAA